MKRTERMLKLIHASSRPAEVVQEVVDQLVESVPPAPAENLREYGIEVTLYVNEQQILDSVNAMSSDVKFTSVGSPKVCLPVQAKLMALDEDAAKKMALSVIRKLTEKSPLISGGSYKLFEGANHAR